MRCSCKTFARYSSFTISCPDCTLHIVTGLMWSRAIWCHIWYSKTAKYVASYSVHTYIFKRRVTWHVITLCIVQCAIMTRNHETTVTLKTHAIDTWRCIILNRIRPMLKIRRATQTQKPCYSVMQCIRAAFANIFVANISASSLFGSDSRNYSVAIILRPMVYPVMVYCTFVCCDL